MGNGTSVGQKIADQLAIPSIEEIYNDGNDNLHRIMDGAGDVKDRTFDNVTFLATLGFIVVGGSVVLYGDLIFDAGVALANRIRDHGIKVGLEI